jgi:integrase
MRQVLRAISRPDLVAAVPKIAVPGPRKRVTGEAQFQAVIQSIPKQRALVLVAMLCRDAGLRSGTAVSLGPGGWDGKRITARTNRGRTANVQATVRLKQMLDALAPVATAAGINFAEAANGRPINVTSIRKQWRKAADNVGMPGLWLHDLRRSTARQLLEHTHDIRQVQSLLGHQSLRSTIWYLDNPSEPSAADIAAAIERTQ